jgi:hypothetical protein
MEVILLAQHIYIHKKQMLNLYAEEVKHANILKLKAKYIF